jgi:hypothetical protein
MLQAPRVDVAQAGRGQIEMPPASTGADQRPRTRQAMGGGQLADGSLAGGAVDVQDVEQVAGGQADVGLGVAGPPGQDPGPVTGGVLDPVRDQAAQGVLANLAAARIPTRTADLLCQLPGGRWCRWGIVAARSSAMGRPGSSAA